MSAEKVKATCLDEARSELNVKAATFAGSVELQKNSALKRSVSTLMTHLGYKVYENRATILREGNPQTSRFHSSRPDMVIYHELKHCTAVIVVKGNDDDDDDGGGAINEYS